tara:strand:+ start:131 stop:502 length:372 start_codon:yes stop_codon:yes gene_type:complete
MFSLLTPMPGLPWYLLPIWPLIFWRIQRLKAWFRETGGPGSQMLWGVMNDGRVVLLRLSDDLSVPLSCSFRAPVSDRLGDALSGDTLAPPSVPSIRRLPAPLAARSPGLRRECGHQTLPRPDT